MRTLFAIAVLVGIGWQSAEAAQICPPGNPRIAPDSRYTDNGNSTVTDNQTGLVWKQCSEGQAGAGCSGVAQVLTWQSAISAGANSSFAGFNDWRVPNVKELESLIETGCYNPAINEVYFPNTSTFIYWTSSSVATNPSAAWHVLFVLGVNDTYNNKGDSARVRLVRGGR